MYGPNDGSRTLMWNVFHAERRTSISMSVTGACSGGIQTAHVGLRSMVTSGGVW